MEKRKKMDKPSFFADLRVYIDSHLTDDVSIEDLAKRYGYSYERFRKIYKSVTGTTLHHYVCVRRLQYAAKQMRLGANVNEASRQIGYQTTSGFIRAFRNLFGVSPYKYAATQGRVLMTGPELQTRPEFWSVGYAFEAVPDLDWMESGAYWQGQLFPAFNAEEFLRIGAGAAEAAVWIRHEGKPVCVFGWEVGELRYTPSDMLAVRIPGGDFMAFRAPADLNTDMMGENIRATWFYAYRQWLPASDYAVDWKRLPYEYYLNEDRLIFIPVKPRTPEAKAAEAAERVGSEHPPELLRGSRGHFGGGEEQ